MNFIKKILKNIVPTSFKYKFYFYFGKKEKDVHCESLSKVFIMLAGDYGNLGDFAITKAQINFIKKALPNYQVVPIYAGQTYKLIKTVRSIIKDSDIITIIGGGNMGDLYEGFENLRRNIIRSFPDNKIISFPQTFDFSDTRNGIKSLNRTIKAYSSHTNLKIFARESISFKKMEKYFKRNTIYLVPDIVLSLEIEKAFNNIRNNIILCLRNDLEKNEMISLDIPNIMEQNFNNVIYRDTHLGNDGYNLDSLNYEFDKLIDDFTKSKLIITDRLHGMILATITGTPCIVFPNKNHKIIGTYNDWLHDLNYIKLITNISDENQFLKEVNSFLEINLKEISLPNFDDKYKSLKEELSK